MSHDTEPEDVKLASIVEREAEEAYPVQYWDGSDIKETFEADSDDLQGAIEAVAKHLMWSDEIPRWEKTYGEAPDEDFFWKRAETVGTRDGYLTLAKELLEIARKKIEEGLQ